MQGATAIGSNQHTSHYSQTILRLFSEFSDYSQNLENHPTVLADRFGDSHTGWWAVGGQIGVFSCFQNSLQKIHFPPTRSDDGKCEIYSIDTFLKITIHSIHSIHYRVENIDVVRVLSGVQFGVQMPKSGRFHPVFQGFSPPPHTCRFTTLGKSGNIHPNVHEILVNSCQVVFQKITYIYPHQVDTRLHKTRGNQPTGLVG